MIKSLTTRDLIQVIDYYKGDKFLLKDNKVLDIYAIQSVDLNGLSEDEISRKIYSFGNFLRGYHFDIKIVSMNFPTVTIKQQEYIRQRINQCLNPLCIPYLTQKLFDLEYLEKNNTDTEFYLMTFTKKEEDISSKELIYRLKDSEFNLLKINLDKKKQILFKLCNQNSRV